MARRPAAHRVPRRHALRARVCAARGILRTRRSSADPLRARRRAHANANLHAAPDRYTTSACAHCYAFANTDPAAHSDGNLHAAAHRAATSNAHADAFANAYPAAHCHCHTFANADPGADGNAYTKPITNSFADPDSITDANADTITHADANTNTHCFAYADPGATDTITHAHP